MVSIQLNIVTCRTYPAYPEKFIQDNVVAPFLVLSVVVVLSPAVVGNTALTQRTIAGVKCLIELSKMVLLI